MSEERSTPESPTTAVIFQAPEPAQPRRASAPAGPPSSAKKDTAPADASDSPKDGAAEKKPAAKKSGSKGSGAKGAKSEAGKGTKSKADAGDSAKGDSKKSGASTAEAADGARDSGTDSAADGAGQGNDDSADGGEGGAKRRRRRGGRGRGRSKNGGEGNQDGQDQQDGSTSEPGNASEAPADDAQGAEDSPQAQDNDDTSDGDGESGGSSRRRRRRRGSRSSGSNSSASANEEQLQGSTRLQAKRQRRRESRDGQRRRPVISEAEFLARRESVKRSMVVREKDHRVQIAVLEDDVLVEHYVSHQAQQSMAGNVYLGRVQNVLPGMEAAFIDVGRGRNAVLYAGEVNWDAAGLEGKPRRIELALKPGDTVMVQVTKDPIGHKGARVTSQISLAGRFLVYVPAGGVTGISRKLPDTERARLKKLLREVIPADAGVIVRTAAEGASEDELRADVERLKRQWESIQAEAANGKGPKLLRGEPDMAIRVVRDIFNEDFDSLTIQGEDTWNSLSAYVGQVAPDLMERLHRYHGEGDVFVDSRVDEQLAKGMDRKVWLPSGGSLVIDRTEAMTVIDVNTGKFVGKGGTLEETMTLNNLEAAEEIVRQLRLRDIGGIIVIDFVDMLLEANRDRVLRRLIECLGRDRTKHQVAEVTSLGLVQMTRKRVGQGLVEAFSETCDHCKGRGFLVHGEPVPEASEKQPERRRGGRNKNGGNPQQNSQQQPQEKKKPAVKEEEPASHSETHALDDREEARAAVKATLASIAAAAEKAHHDHEDAPATDATSDVAVEPGSEVTDAAEPVAASAPDTTTPSADSAPAEGANDAPSAAAETDAGTAPPVAAESEGDDTQK
ncbi:Rne/Rng family ribonuclease [Demequina globuliformis]|uniref:Rne/Rng family ribonuclease n=1 Tax=Demequina globuliformis TaxID=676202 RepID=UPI000786048D|nr:Rne/Rng family ribonuclease [Demequina globuliformis]